MNKLYISDLDGTLLTPESTLPPSAMKRLNYLIGRGLKFTIATARNYDSVHPILSGLDFKFPVILFNGVYLTDFHTGKNISDSHFLHQDLMDRMIDPILEQGLDPFVYTYGEKHQVLYRNINNAGAQAYFDSLAGAGRLQFTENYHWHPDHDISGLLLIDQKQALQPVYEHFSEKFHSDISMYFAEDIYHSGFFWLQIFHRHANKGNMVKYLAKHLNIPLSDVVVFGDYLNDLDMFEIAGHSVAVANALPEIKQAAKEVIGSNQEFAVIDFLENRGFGKLDGI